MNRNPGFIKKTSHLCDKLPYSAIQLPAAISIWESSGFLVLRSENVQFPEGRNLGKLYPSGFLSKYFRPHLVNRVDFSPSMTSARITPAPAVAAYRLTPELSGFSHICDKLASISLNGKYYRLSNISRLEVKPILSSNNIMNSQRSGRIGH